MEKKPIFDKNISTIPNLKPNEVKKDAPKGDRKAETIKKGAGGR